MATGLIPPSNLNIDFQPSSKQYEVWKCLQPECPICGGKIEHIENGKDRNGNATYKPVCTKCGNDDIPQIILEGGAAGGGKMLPLDSKICTPTGFKYLKDIKVGDFITNPITGGAQEVVWLHPLEKHHFYRIHFIDGTYIDSSEGHLWNVHQAGKRTKRTDLNGDKMNERVKPTKWIFEWVEKHKQGSYKGRSLIIPLTSPVKFAISTVAARKNIIEPYVLGALLGDGCISKKYPELTTMDQDIIDRFTVYGYDMSKISKKADSKATQYYIYSDKLAKAIKKLNLTGCTSINKFIPDLYKYATVEERIELMQGLMDTDGYVDDRGHMSYSTISKQLAEDVAFIVRSLGGVATIKKGAAGYKKDGEYIQCNDCYDVHFRTKINPELVSIPRKKERAKYEFNGGASELGKRIVDVEYIGEQTSRCITVDDPSGLYVVDDFTVTHNSFLGASWLISCCLRWPNMRMVVGRKTLKSLRESTWNTICMIAKDWGLKEGVNYKINNLSGEMTFWNDSKIIMKELSFQPSDPSYLRFGSSEFSGCFLDECGELDEKAVEILFSRIRWNIPNTLVVPKMLMSTNPCLGWVRSRFVLDDDGNDVICKKYERYIPFSVYDNPDSEFRRQYLNGLMRISNKADRERLLYGNWQYVDVNEMAAYWNFDGAKHLVDGLREKVYNPMNPLISGWDFNVAPYMSELEFQFDFTNKKIYILEENIGKPEEKENNTPKLAIKIREKHLSRQHLGGIIVTGDPSGAARSTQTEEGVNNYTIIVDNMKNSVLKPRIKLLQKQPPQTTRLEFVNAILNGFNGWQVMIDMRCRKLTEDMVYQQKNSDGTKAKKKVLNPKTGGKEEKYGHLSDILDYVLVLFLNNEWRRFQNQKTTIETYTAPVYNTFEY